MKPLLSESLICRKILVKLIYRICSDRSGRFREYIWQKTKILDNPRYDALSYRIRLQVLVALIIVRAHDCLVLHDLSSCKSCSRVSRLSIFIVEKTPLKLLQESLDLAMII